MAPTRRRVFLINKKFQLRFALYVVLWLLALSFVYPLIVQNIFEYFVRYLALDPHGPGVEGLLKTRNDVLMLLILMQILFLGMSFLISLFMSHRIAGPLYKLHKFFNEGQSAGYPTRLFFRKKDYFQDLAEDYNAMVDSVQARLHQGEDSVNEAIDRLQAALDSKDSDELSGQARKDVAQALDRLKSIPKLPPPSDS